MNAERLHAVVIAIVSDLKKTRVQEIFKALVGNLQNMVNQPNQASFQQQVGRYRQEIKEALYKSAANDFSPTWKQVVTEIGGEGLLGKSLASRIDEVFAENQITPSVALEKLQALQQSFDELVDAVSKVDTAFYTLKVPAEDLDPGQCEISVLIPRALVSNKLDLFATEVAQLDRIFGVFAELVTGSRPGFQIRTISSSDLSLYLDAAHDVCAAIAVSLEWIINCYQKLLEIRKLRNDLKAQGVSDQALRGIESEANGKMDEGILELAAELERRYLKDSGDGRHNELSIELKYSLKKIANRIDRGMNIEVRMSEPEGIEFERDKGDPVPKEEESYEVIRAASQKMQFLNMNGEPILRLEESEPDNAIEPAV